MKHLCYLLVLSIAACGGAWDFPIIVTGNVIIPTRDSSSLCTVEAFRNNKMVDFSDVYGVFETTFVLFPEKRGLILIVSCEGFVERYEFIIDEIPTGPGEAIELGDLHFVERKKSSSEF